MIVPSMTHKEICDALFSDRPKLQIRAQSSISRISKQFKKDNKFPAWKWEEYTHQGSQNKYLITYFAPTLERANNPFVKYLAFLEEPHQRVVIECGHWPYRKYGSLNIQKIRAISFYCPHFFQRYRERVLKGDNISYYELLCRYFWRNTVNVPIKLNANIQRNYHNYGDFGTVSFQEKEGVCFVRHWCEGDELSIGTRQEDFFAVVLYMTIVTDSMMSETQNKAVEEEGRKFINGYCKRLFEDAMKGPYISRINSERNDD